MRLKTRLFILRILIMNYKEKVVNKYFALFLYLHLFVFVPSLCFAAKKDDVIFIENPVLVVIFYIVFGALSLFFLTTPIWMLVLVYFGYKRFLKWKNKKYCIEKNLKYVETSSTIPFGNDFSLVNLGDNRSFSELMVGEQNGIPFILGEYNFRLSSNQTIQKCQVIICVMVNDSSDLNMPHFSLNSTQMNRPPAIYLHKMIKALNPIKSAKTENTKFDSLFNLRSDDEFSAKQFFNEKMQKVIMDSLPDYDYICEGSKNCLMVCFPSPSLLGKKIDLLNYSTELYSKIMDNRF